ncbi:hypothetical protein AAEX28_08335 [Lentisphaerota bacterium WC36G]|nr:hypothetical protein LJT99_11190 [Lentisphaerae bacterium WC36]
MFFRKNKNNSKQDDAESRYVDSKHIKVAQYVDVKELISSELNEIKEQIFNYGEICEVLNTKSSNPEAYIDKLFVLLQSFRFSVVSLCIVDEDGKLEIFSRGYNEELDEDLINQWQEAVETESNLVDWNKLLSNTQSEKSKVNDLLVTENLGKIGFSPIEECGTIFGFIFIGVKVGEEANQLASNCLETLGSRIGIVLRHYFEKNKSKDVLLSYRSDCHDQLRVLNGTLERLEQKVLESDAEVKMIVKECQRISEGIMKL